jgi:hypothetical protein
VGAVVGAAQIVRAVEVVEDVAGPPKRLDGGAICAHKHGQEILIVLKPCPCAGTASTNEHQHRIAASIRAAGEAAVCVGGEHLLA